MIIYDKARWQIDGGISTEIVINHFKFIFKWLNEHNLLSEYGVSTYMQSIDENAVLIDEMLTDRGNEFLVKYYDEYIAKVEYGVKEDDKLLMTYLKELN